MLNPSLALTRQMHREYPISQIELWQQPGLVAGIALTLSAFPLERRVAQLFRRGGFGGVRSWVFVSGLDAGGGGGKGNNTCFFFCTRRRGDKRPTQCSCASRAPAQC